MSQKGGEPVGEKGEGRKEKRKERKEKQAEKVKGQGMRCDFSPHSSSSSDLQVESIERSQGKPKTSKFFMVGKLDFYVFHA